MIQETSSYVKWKYRRITSHRNWEYSGLLRNLFPFPIWHTFALNDVLALTRFCDEMKVTYGENRFSLICFFSTIERIKCYNLLQRINWDTGVPVTRKFGLTGFLGSLNISIPHEETIILSLIYYEILELLSPNRQLILRSASLRISLFKHSVPNQDTRGCLF